MAGIKLSLIDKQSDKIMVNYPDISHSIFLHTKFLSKKLLPASLRPLDLMTGACPLWSGDPMIHLQNAMQCWDRSCTEYEVKR